MSPVVEYMCHLRSAVLEVMVQRPMVGGGPPAIGPYTIAFQGPSAYQYKGALSAVTLHHRVLRSALCLPAHIIPDTFPITSEFKSPIVGNYVVPLRVVVRLALTWN